MASVKSNFSSFALPPLLSRDGNKSKGDDQRSTIDDRRSISKYLGISNRCRIPSSLTSLTRVETEMNFFHRTVCGTPNYIAPEVLTKIGHSYEADIWSIGCIMYTLLVGKPPFETASLRETYARIKQVQYKTPTHMSKSAINMVSNMLQLNPSKRPSVAKLMKDVFFTSGKSNR